MPQEVGVVLMQVTKPVADMVDHYAAQWGIPSHDLIRMAISMIYVAVERRDPVVLDMLHRVSEANKRERDAEAGRLLIAQVGP